MISIVLFSNLGVMAQNEVFQWAGSIGGSSYDLGAAITTDAAGNVYSTGAIQGVAIDLDPGPLGYFVSANGGYDTYIHKVNANGYFEWAKTFGGTQNDVGLAIALDGDGNIFITGHFFGTTDFDPGAGVTELTSNGARDVYILKLDANGNFLWARSFGAANDDYGHSIATDANGNVYVAGKFKGTVDLDPGVAELNFTSNGNDDMFIQKLDGDGNLLWVKAMGGANNDRAFSITTDATGNVYTTGAFVGTVDFDPGVGTLDLSTGLTGFDIFILKLDTDGNLIWAKVMGSTNWDYGVAITTDASQNVYTTGYFHLTADFDPGAGTANLTSHGEADIFVQKLDVNGDFLWAKSMGSSAGDSYGNAIGVDASGNVYTTGEFYGTVDFDPGAGTNYLTSSGFNDIYYQKLDANGNFLWATKFGSTSSDLGQGIAITANGDICATGYFGSTVDFDPGPGTTNLTAVGGDSEVFIQKFSQPSTVGILDNNQDAVVTVYPNPTNGDIRINLAGFEAPRSLKIYDMTGKMVHAQSLASNTAIDCQLPETQGIYLVQIIGLDGTASNLKVVKN